jgi:hypothetical protein
MNFYQKKLSSQNKKNNFGRQTLIFNYAAKRAFFGKYLGKFEKWTFFLSKISFSIDF